MKPLRISHFPALLGLSDEAGVRAMYRESMSPRAKLLEVFLSVLQHDGRAIGPVGRAHLDMAHRRAHLYEQMAHRLGVVFPDAVVLKGAAIARRYPQGFWRSSVDLDVYLPTPEMVWQAAAVVSNHAPIYESNVSIRRTVGGYDVFVGLTWECQESALDPIYRVELSTLPFLGDGGTVPARLGIPPDALVRNFLLVAEEQFQRAMIGRDIVDAAVLLSCLAEADCEAAAEEIACWRLAPEALELCLAVGRLGLCESGQAAVLERKLAARAEEEATLRQAGSDPVPPVEYGFPLAPGQVTATALMEEHDFGTVLRSPLGTYLLVNTVDVDPEVYQAACTAVGVEPDLGEPY